MTKKIGILLAACMVFSLAACGGSKQESKSAETEIQTEVQTESQTEAQTQESAQTEENIIVTINADGFGNIAYAEGDETPEADPEFPYQSAQISPAGPAEYTILAWPDAGSRFVKWTKDGEDYSTEAQIKVLLDKSAEFIAVFEEDSEWQNPVMNFVGEYQCDRAHAMVESYGNDEAWIAIDWGGSATEMAHWDIIGQLNTETLTIDYSGCTKSIITYDEDGKPVGQETEYEDGTGSIVFHEDGSFTWHEDQSENGSDLVFEWVPAAE